MKESGVKVKLAESTSAADVEWPISAPYQDQRDQVAIEPVAVMEKQYPVAVRDLEPEKGLKRPVVKTQPSCNTRV